MASENGQSAAEFTAATPAITPAGPTPLLSLEHLLSEEQRVDRALHCSMKQICVLNRGMSQLLVRYGRTSASSGRRAHRYHLRLRMAVLEGVRAMYYEYALGQTDELEQIRNAIKKLPGQPESDSDSETDSGAGWRMDDSAQI